MEINTTAVTAVKPMIMNGTVLGGWQSRSCALPVPAVRELVPNHGSPRFERVAEHKTIDPILVMGGYAADDFGTPQGSRPGRPPV